MRWRLAYSSPTRDGHALEALFRRCGALGLNGLQLRPEQYGLFLGDPAGFLGRWSQWVPLICGLRVCCDVRSDPALEHFEKTIDLAVGIDGDLLVLAAEGPPVSGDLRTRDEALARLEHFGRAARSKGLRLSVSNEADGLVASRRDLETLAGAANADALGLTLNTAQLVLAGETDLGSLARDFCDRLDNIHLTDIARSRFPMLEDNRTEPRRLGEGDVDFRPLFEALAAMDYAGWLTVEGLADGAGEAADEMSRAVAFLRRFGLAHDSPE